MTGYAYTTRTSWELMVRQALRRYAEGLSTAEQLQETLHRWTARAERETVSVRGWHR